MVENTFYLRIQHSFSGGWEYVLPEDSSRLCQMVENTFYLRIQVDFVRWLRIRFTCAFRQTFLDGKLGAEDSFYQRIQVDFVRWRNCELLNSTQTFTRSRNTKEQNLLYDLPNFSSQNMRVHWKSVKRLRVGAYWPVRSQLRELE